MRLHSFVNIKVRKKAYFTVTHMVMVNVVIFLTVFLFLLRSLIYVKKKAKIKNGNNHVLHMTQDTIWKSNKNTTKHHTQQNKEVSHFPAGDHKIAKNRQDSMTKTNTKHK